MSLKMKVVIAILLIAAAIFFLPRFFKADGMGEILVSHPAGRVVAPMPVGTPLGQPTPTFSGPISVSPYR